VKIWIVYVRGTPVPFATRSEAEAFFAKKIADGADPQDYVIEPSPRESAPIVPTSGVSMTERKESLNPFLREREAIEKAVAAERARIEAIVEAELGRWQYADDNDIAEARAGRGALQNVLAKIRGGT
jgi:hypothetical protein